MPLERQFEQTLNSLYLEKLGYGEYHEKLSEEAIVSFLAKTPQYTKNLESYPHRQDRNRLIFAAIDGLVARVARARKKSSATK